MTTPSGHTAWCAGGHLCTLGEHRARPVTVRAPGAGSVVLTRIRATDGTQHAEVRMSVILPDQEPQARQRLVALLTHLQTLIGPARTPSAH
jgi:hypothetical protein